MFFSSKKYSRYIYIYKKRKRRNYCYASVHIPMSACYEPLWYGQLPVMREDYCYYWWLSCDRFFVWPHHYWTCAMLSTSSDRILYVIIGKESQFVVLSEDINDCNHGKVILRHKYQYQNLKFFFWQSLLLFSIWLQGYHSVIW